VVLKAVETIKIIKPFRLVMLHLTTIPAKFDRNCT